MIDFQNVKSIVIPEGEVSVIARGDEILWRKQKYKCEVEYLESTGTQYIDTGYKPKTNTRIVADALFNSWNGQSANYIFGVFGSPNNYGLNAGSARTRFNVPWGTHNGIELNGLVPQLNVRYLFDISKSGYYIDGVAYGNLSAESVSSDKTMYLFWSNGTSALAMKGRIYYCKAWESGVLVRDYIPVLDWNDRPCMYDRVTDELFYNQGTGEFIAGRQIHPVAWLESTGTQYVNTGYKGNTTRTRYETKIIPTSIATQALFGSRNNSAGSTPDNCVVFIVNNSFRLDWVSGDGNGAITIPATANTPYVISITRGNAVINDVPYEFAEASSVEQNNNFCIGNFTNGSAAVFNGGFIGKTCYSKLYDNNILVRDYIPAHDENGVGFMFDRVTHTIFDNAGTGEFLYGLEGAA